MYLIKIKTLIPDTMIFINNLLKSIYCFLLS
jgi:hypothetical protein